MTLHAQNLWPQPCQPLMLMDHTPNTPPRATVTDTCKNTEAFNQLPFYLYLGFWSLQTHWFVFSLGRMLPHVLEDRFKNYSKLANQHSSLETE